MVSFSQHTKPYDAQVFINGADIVAVDRKGTPISAGTAGVHDDIVIQAALTAVGVTSGTVSLGSGVYTIYATLVVPSYVNLVGQGHSTELYAANGLNDNVLLLDGVVSNTISEIMIHGNSAGNVGGSGIVITHAAPGLPMINVHDVFIWGSADYGVVIGANSSVTTMRDSIIMSCGLGPVYDDSKTSIVSNVYGYAPVKNQRDTISNLLEILGDVRGLYPGTDSAGNLLHDYSVHGHDAFAWSNLSNFFDFWGKTYTYYMSSAIPTYVLTVGDDPDFSFGDGVTDDAFSLVCAFQRSATGACTVMSKRDDTLAQIEWYVTIGAGATSPITFTCYDQSVPAYINVVSSDIIWDEDWHVLVVTYDGSSVETGLTVYYDGVDISLAHNINGVYVAMENLAADVGLGCHLDNGVPTGMFTGEMTWFGITGKELDIDEVWSIRQRILEVLGL